MLWDIPSVKRPITFDIAPNYGCDSLPFTVKYTSKASRFLGFAHLTYYKFISKSEHAKLGKVTVVMVVMVGDYSIGNSMRM